MKRKGSTQQIPFTGFSFVILGTKRLDCTYGVDRCTPTKKKRLEKKKLNRYEANLARTLPPSPIFLLEKPIFYVLTHILLISKAASCD